MQMNRANATIWVVGDSTVSAFNDSYYIPREGYGSQIENYFSARVYNLARSGASSKDFTGMSNYRDLMQGLGSAEGAQFLIIGFGHNDEKSEEARYTDPNGTFRTPGSFAHSLYTNYIKPALERNVIPVVCTPVARLTQENTPESYNSIQGHITRDQTVGGRLFRGGNYRKAALDMVVQLRHEGLYVEFIDLTGATMAENVSLGCGAQYLHSFAGAKRAEDGSLIPTGLDMTHTNRYGAALNAWLISALAAQTAPRLAVFSLNAPKPAYETSFSASVNSGFRLVEYKAPTQAQMDASTWPVFTGSDGTLWHGTAFGDYDNTAVSDKKPVVSIVSCNEITLCGTKNSGRITSYNDAVLFYYVKLPAGKEFTLSARAKIYSFAPANQTSFGLMVRDDLFIDSCISAPMGDYVAAGVLNQGAAVNFGRKSGTLVCETPGRPVSLSPGTVAELKIVANREGFALSYDNETVSAGFDYPLTGVDPEYVYAGFYVAGEAEITFENVRLQGVFYPIAREM